MNLRRIFLRHPSIALIAAFSTVFILVLFGRFFLFWDSSIEDKIGRFAIKGSHLSVPMPTPFCQTHRPACKCNYAPSSTIFPVKIRRPNWTHYDPLGVFEQFNNVALRQRVRCIEPITGMPMSTQWAINPYFYPIQILQFGLERYNRIKTENPPIIQLLAKRVQFQQRKTKAKGPIDDLIELRAVDLAWIQLDSQLPVLLFSLATLSLNSQFVLELEQKRLGRRRMLKLRFIHSSKEGCVWKRSEKEVRAKEPSAMYSLGAKPTMDLVEFVLDVPVYAAKALTAICAESKNGTSKRAANSFSAECADLRATELLPRKLLVRGPCLLRLSSFRQQSSAHSEMFKQVAQWLLARQDEKGGWAVPIARTIVGSPHHRLFLPVGWYSAMAQGHALSFLTRAYASTGNAVLLSAAQRALALFQVPANEGGVLNRLFGLPWFEEYPTTPTGTFVLNGFMYALIGLNDFADHSNTSRRLFNDGLHSLRALLPLFDTGHRSLYDLRHIGLTGSKPNVARWDYHMLHVFQLFWMHSITGDPLFEEFAKRWSEYAREASHS